MSTILPTPRQIEYQDWEMGLFLHFGPRTFHEGFRDMDERRMSLDAFLPTALDCRQWARTAREAGCGYVVLTAKHHDGFANWPSKTTGFSVANTPWKDGKGDVIAEFTEACRAEGLAVGLYYSPYDADCPVYEDDSAYDDFFVTQISELLTPYGQIDILWFDGCGSGDHAYDWPRIMGEIRRMQPNILIFNMGDPDFRWIGNEEGYAPLGTRNVVESVPVAVDTDTPQEVQRTWLPAECDSRMRERNWFFSEKDEHTVKSLEDLLGMYYYSVGRGTNMLINIGPDRRGLLPEKDAKRLIELGKAVKERFANPICTLEAFTRDERGWTCVLEDRPLVDHVVIREDIAKGEHVMRFRLVASVGNDVTVFEGRTVGHKAICQFPAIRARKITLEVLDAEGEVSLAAIDVHHVG